VRATVKPTIDDYSEDVIKIVTIEKSFREFERY
jgi:hypothetical protein